MSMNILLCGVGGQGIVLASRVIAAAAMNRGERVLSAETIGMAQKGGSVFSHVRIGEDAMSPMISLGEADLILGFEPAETVRMLPYLREGGKVVVCEDPVMPASASLLGEEYTGAGMVERIKSVTGEVISVKGRDRCADLGSAKVLNLIMLGEAVRSGGLGFTMDEVRDAVKERVKPEFLQLNLRALESEENI